MMWSIELRVDLASFPGGLGTGYIQTGLSWCRRSLVSSLLLPQLLAWQENGTNTAVIGLSRVCGSAVHILCGTVCAQLASFPGPKEGGEKGLGTRLVHSIVRVAHMLCMQCTYRKWVIISTIWYTQETDSAHYKRIFALYKWIFARYKRIFARYKRIFAQDYVRQCRSHTLHNLLLHVTCGMSTN